MKEIPLTQGQVALVDDWYYPLLIKHKWHTARTRKSDVWYVRRSVSMGYYKSKIMMMHHYIIGRPPTGFNVDHIDRNGLNNQRSNLRFVTNRDNCNNSNRKKTSKYPGVWWNKYNQNWRSTMTINGKRVEVGSFKNEEDAYFAYVKMKGAL